MEHAILPLRGKVLNTWEVERDRLFANTEIHDIAVAIGVPGAFVLDRLEFPGKEAFRRLVLLPLILPGIITGVALQTMKNRPGLRIPDPDGLV